MSSLFTETVERFGAEAIQNIQDELGDQWAQLTESQRASARRAARRLVELELREKRGEDVEQSKKFVQTTVDGFKLVGEIALYNAFTKGVAKALEALASFLGTLAGSALLGVL